jgi:hypothetical protein
MSADGCKLVGVYVDGLDFSLDAVVADLQSTPAPALAVASSGGSLFLSWVVPSIDFVLEQNADLGTTNWTDAAKPSHCSSAGRTDVLPPHIAIGDPI